MEGSGGVGWWVTGWSDVRCVFVLFCRGRRSEAEATFKASAATMGIKDDQVVAMETLDDDQSNDRASDQKSEGASDEESQASGADDSDKSESGSSSSSPGIGLRDADSDPEEAIEEPKIKSAARGRGGRGGRGKSAGRKRAPDDDVPGGGSGSGRIPNKKTKLVDDPKEGGALPSPAGKVRPGSVEAAVAKGTQMLEDTQTKFSPGQMWETKISNRQAVF